MKAYKSTISLNRNSREVWSIDPIMGCHSGTKDNKNGCYNDCYAVKAARIHGYEFGSIVLRCFESEAQRLRTVKQISRIPLPFVRMGTMGDPSENWEHTLKICKDISDGMQLSLFHNSKQIVIITKHWHNLTDAQIMRLKQFNLCVNTSVSALDNFDVLENGLVQYQRLKPYCKSILRIVSADFNLDNPMGAELAKIQEDLFKHDSTLDTVLRVGKNNPYVKSGTIRIKESKFLGRKQYMSKYNRKTYTGKCGTCKEMCGVTI